MSHSKPHVVIDLTIAERHLPTFPGFLKVLFCSSFFYLLCSCFYGDVWVPLGQLKFFIIPEFFNLYAQIEIKRSPILRFLLVISFIIELAVT